MKYTEPRKDPRYTARIDVKHHEISVWDDDFHMISAFYYNGGYNVTHLSNGRIAVFADDLKRCYVDEIVIENGIAVPKRD